MSALSNAVVGFDQVLDAHGVKTCSLTLRERLVDVEGPVSRFGTRPYLEVVDVRVHVLKLVDAERVAATLGLAESSRDVVTFGLPASERREHVTWSGLVLNLPDVTAPLHVEVLALGPLPASKVVVA